MVRDKPSILLLDLRLDGADSTRMIRRLLRLNAQTKILVFSASADESECTRTLLAGARGCCNINIDAVLLRKAVQMVQKGELWIDRKCVAYLLHELLDRSRAPAPRPAAHRHPGMNKLTAREAEIVQAIGSGNSNKQIAADLHIAEATVKAHLSSVFDKLGVADRLQLALLIHARPPRRPGYRDSD